MKFLFKIKELHVFVTHDINTYQVQYGPVNNHAMWKSITNNNKQEILFPIPWLHCDTDV